MPLAPHLPATEARVHAALIVALDAGDLAGSELARARQLTASCAGCAALVMDLVAIRGAMTTLPVPARRRDYRLAGEDAARLRPSGWRRVIAWLAAPRSSVRPLATGLATLGVVGLLLTAGIPGFQVGAGTTALSTVGAPAGDAGAPAGDAGAEGVPGNDYVGTSAPALAPSAAPVPAASAAPSAAPGELNPAGVAGDTSSPTPEAERNATAGGKSSAGDKAAATDTVEPAVPVAILVSLALLLAGIGLFLARVFARRRLA